ncbi:hypothetical protein [Acidihalobacter prosperus]|uniref:Uncharacterized protein n=1 Tax=Acidihalobacter prosperus TaxID=160660 RepID=A0A1A6C1H1_9GAMM|nr:hypothetical protein [Acidihalobacter prosperus]OBS08408.1 hypothetical protein Thpro_022658 [Acidihalobacter prosperus]
MTQPLSQDAFDRQVEVLFSAHGAGAFAACAGALPDFTLFVDGEHVVAEPQGSPRHRYGAYCELEEPLTGEALEVRVRRWLRGGEAYTLYLSMNVCRYSC